MCQGIHSIIVFFWHGVYVSRLQYIFFQEVNHNKGSSGHEMSVKHYVTDVSSTVGYSFTYNFFSRVYVSNCNFFFWRSIINKDHLVMGCIHVCIALCHSHCYCMAFIHISCFWQSVCFELQLFFFFWRSIISKDHLVKRCLHSTMSQSLVLLLQGTHSHITFSAEYMF